MWYVEEPLIIATIIVVLEVILIGVLIQTQKQVVIVGIILVALIGGGWLLAEQSVVTEREEVEFVLYDTCDALEQGDQPRVLGHLASNAVAIQGKVRQYMQMVSFERADIKRFREIHIRPNSNPPLATATFNAVAAVRDSSAQFGQSVPRLLVVTLVKENGAWKIRHYEAYLPTEKLPDLQ